MSARPRVLISRPDPPSAGTDILKATCDVWIWSGEDHIPAEEFKKRAAGVTAIFCQSSDRIDKELLDTAVYVDDVIPSPTPHLPSPPPSGINPLKEVCDVWIWPGDDPIPVEEFEKHAVGVTAIFCHQPDRIDKDLLEAAGPSLKVVGTMSVGLEHIDLEECRRRGIKVGHCPNVLNDAVAELTIALLLSAARRLKEGYACTSGEEMWENAMFLCGHEVSGSTVGIVGLGRIGMAVARRLKSFNVAKFLYSGNSQKPYAEELDAEFASFDKLLADSDFVIACCSINRNNRGLFNKDAFKKMKKSSVFVNVSRGVLVNHEDLIEALTTGEIYAAGLDVTEPEPLPADSPLYTLKNCLVTPHIGSASIKARNAMASLTARNILAGIKGEDLPGAVP